MTILPIDDILPELLHAVRTNPNCILHAPPGAGKTTRVPLSLLEIIAPENGRIFMLEPRRLAAVSAARWMARCLGEEVGQTVGYSIRFDSRVSPSTRIEVVTEGILTRRIQSDPLLEGVAMLIFDEFHERSLQADLGLALALDVQRQVRPDLKILVMSATLETGPLAGLLGDAPLLTSVGRSYPVEEIFIEGRGHAPLPHQMAATIMRAVHEREGDILAFLPGSGEIRSCDARLADAGFGERGIAVHQLYGDLPFDRQQAAIVPGKQRRVILATSIAETSLTIEGVSIVIDSGLSRRMKHDLASGMNRLVTVRESRSSAIQRAGRAGRLGPGVCYRLFGRNTFLALTPHSPPEILEADLSGLLLELAAWGCSEPQALAWLDPPAAGSVATARTLLLDLGALDASGRIMPAGSAMAGLPLHPRLARLLLKSRDLGCSGLGCDLAALLSERDIIRSGPAGGGSYSCDIADRVRILADWRASGRAAAGVDIAALKGVERVAAQLQRMLDSSGAKKIIGDGVHELTGALLLAAYPDRVALQREAGSGRYLLANGSGALFREANTLSSCHLLVVPNLSGGAGREAVIHLAAEVSEEMLRGCLGERIETRESVSWDSREGRMTALREERLGSLVLASRAVTPDPARFIDAIVAAVRDSNLGLLNLDDRFRQLQARIMLVSQAFPGNGWPDVSDRALLATLEEWLTLQLSGVRNEQQLARVDCAAALSARLEYRRARELDELAPTHLAVPSGSRIRLDYCAGEHPVLAVKLQELFGLAETPTVAGGRVGVLLHLLSPAGRPLQVTQDLKGFWDGSYHQVKKEMKGRYPKHPWPDDPWNASPTRRVKPSGRQVD
ncbi:MAG: ATP-dependent helicase HrpB [Geobacteraceae bacterium]|nr:ATP-dependent helicase HrpB [Geobacteraceae bacterium]